MESSDEIKTSDSLSLHLKQIPIAGMIATVLAEYSRVSLKKANVPLTFQKTFEA